MRATLTFSLPREAVEHRDALNGTKWRLLVWELLESYLKPQWKHGDDDNRAEWAAGVKDWIIDNMIEDNLSTDE